MLVLVRIGFQDTGKRTQLSCLGVPAWLTFILSSEHSFIHSFIHAWRRW